MVAAMRRAGRLFHVTGRCLGAAAFSNNLMPGSLLVLHYWDEDLWHERVLVWPAGDGVWSCFTPGGDHGAEFVDCTDPDGPDRTALVEHNGRFPRAALEGEFYRFREYPSDDTLRGLIRMVRDDGDGDDSK